MFVQTIDGRFLRLVRLRIPFITLLVFLGSAVCAQTVPSWEFQYGKVIMLQGDMSQRTPQRLELAVKRDILPEIGVSFNYPNKGTADGQLEVKMGSQVIKSLKSSIQSGNFFIVPIKQIINTRIKGRQYEVDFFYSDDKGIKNLKLGTLIFIT